MGSWGVQRVRKELRVWICSRVTCVGVDGCEEMQEGDSWSHHDVEELDRSPSRPYKAGEYGFIRVAERLRSRVILTVFGLKKKEAQKGLRGWQFHGYIFLRNWEAVAPLCQVWGPRMAASGKGRSHNCLGWSCWTLASCLEQCFSKFDVHAKSWVCCWNAGSDSLVLDGSLKLRSTFSFF